MATKDAAKQDVEAIAKEYGFIHLRRKAEGDMLANNEKMAHPIITLAENIYSSDARFIFELLQNADENQFTRAVAAKEQPSISFNVFPDRIIIEYNDDGFTKANLSAICSVRESTKATSYGYIGAKGIGFQSVFMAAWKVEIQSGNYSFYFEHDRGDLGIGMVLPVWQDVSNELPGSLTRITLHLRQKGDPKDIDHLQRAISQQLNDLEPTCLLFLRNLKEIKVSFFDQDGLPISKMFHLEGNATGRVSLAKKSTDERGKESLDMSRYYVTRYVGSGLPNSENREVPASPEGQQNSAQAETVLAFPIGQDNQPLFTPQSVFAFLPIRKTSFKFLIQSDFDTTTSRQDISSTSERNIKLLDHIAAAFCQAVLDFISDKDFLYTWPLYLPSPEDATDIFGSDGLHRKILENVSQHEIIRTQNGKLVKIEKVQFPTRDFKDSHGRVLLDDKKIDPFISDHYSQEARRSLERYGLKSLSIGIIMDLLKKDLESLAPKMQYSIPSEDFHSCMAKLLSRFASKYQLIRRELRTCKLIPLRDGAWVSIVSGFAYFPHSNGIAIPNGLQFRILDPIATANEDRKAFFSLLGVRMLAVKEVRRSILERNFSANSAECGPLKILQSKEDLVFLYQTHQTSETDTMIRSIGIVSDELRLVCPNRSVGSLQDKSESQCYLPSDDPYGPKLLLAAKDALPGLKVPFVHQTYLSGIPEGPKSNGPSWIEWLQKTVGVRERLSLIGWDGQSLSPTWYYLVKHRPKKLLGYLQHAWKFEGAQISSTKSLRLLLQETDVSQLSTSIRELPTKCRLDEAYLPLPSLVKQSKRFLGENDAFPFLQLEKSSNEMEINTNWLFLHSVLDVKKDDGIEFLLDILKWIKNSSPYFPTDNEAQRVFDLYSALFTKYTVSKNKKELREYISSFFRSGDYIYAPNFDRASVTAGACSRWISPEFCLLQGPKNLISKYPLETKYRHCASASASVYFGPSADEIKLSSIMNLFSQVLNIKYPSWRDMIVELAYHRDHERVPFFTSSLLNSILNLYRYIHAMDVSDSVEDLRREFRENSLIFVKIDSKIGWYKSSECLWSSTTKTCGKVMLNEHYAELEVFFLDTLGVQTLSLQMAYDEMLSIDSKATTQEIKSKLWRLNALLLTDDTDVDPKPLLRKSIFPVIRPDGSSALYSTDTEFAIGDDEHLVSRFRGKIKILDLTLEEIRSLEPFFSWANLSHRYISTSCQSLILSSVKTKPFNPSPMRDLARKAHAILRIAYTFNSPRYQVNSLELYKLLRTATFEVANPIYSILRIVQDGRPAEVQETTTTVDISETPSGLTICIPPDRKAQEICFCDILPKRIVDWLMSDPSTHILEPFPSDMLKIVTMMFSIHPLAVDSVLDREGIVEVDIANEDNRSENDLSSKDDFSSERSAQFDTNTFSANPLFSKTIRLGSPTTQDVQSPAESPATKINSFTTSQFARSGTYTSDSLFNDLSPDLLYKLLLDRVLQAARAASFPSHAAFNTAELNRALPGEERLGLYEERDGLEEKLSSFVGPESQPELEEDNKLGAAGELYAFELLNGLSKPFKLPYFDSWNWRSEIRRYVAVHPDYDSMIPWHKEEKADIIYNDADGVFTALLIDSGYMDAGKLRAMRPKYFIKIGTTTGPLGTPFSMSKSQFEGMAKTHRTGDTSEVYLIFHVFEILGPGIGMRVYLDLDQLRWEDGLVFIKSS